LHSNDDDDGQIVGNNSFATAATLATYNNLSLLSVSPANPGQVLDFGRLLPPDNATPGFRYVVDAIPNGTGNYNLGLIVYDKNFTRIHEYRHVGRRLGADFFAVVNAGRITSGSRRSVIV
jgi:hypothetical protein